MKVRFPKLELDNGLEAVPKKCSCKYSNNGSSNSERKPVMTSVTPRQRREKMLWQFSWEINHAATFVRCFYDLSAAALKNAPSAE
jgi:hypothetical protein